MRSFLRVSGAEQFDVLFGLSAGPVLAVGAALVPDYREYRDRVRPRYPARLAARRRRVLLGTAHADCPLVRRGRRAQPSLSLRKAGALSVRRRLSGWDWQGWPPIVPDRSCEYLRALQDALMVPVDNASGYLGIGLRSRLDAALGRPLRRPCTVVVRPLPPGTCARPSTIVHLRRP